MDNNEIPKYRKQKPSKSKSTSKSDHKHQYEDCLLVNDENHPHKAEYCTICGKSITSKPLKQRELTVDVSEC